MHLYPVSCILRCWEKHDGGPQPDDMPISGRMSIFSSASAPSVKDQEPSQTRLCHGAIRIIPNPAGPEPPERVNSRNWHDEGSDERNNPVGQTGEKPWDPTKQNHPGQ
ncbi:hypothetical protein ASPCADRAFT_11275 [Aspergillus carbonarius ITEM 5010]|uniref:Uncharacterized protein n=1 Tax=Aspergillus carbonarius (strain ITEM 5010) TaxID=602072 RepID=A0A1R3R5Q3_ASPC5|nr:hypothetical protein ASPCADRAFT_11275 [Aspergillus carbonarius ITEM 5010]